MFTAVSDRKKSAGLMRCGRVLPPTCGEEMESHFLLLRFTKIICALLSSLGKNVELHIT